MYGLYTMGVFLLVTDSFAFPILGILNPNMLFILTSAATSMTVRYYCVFMYSLVIKLKRLSTIDTQWTDRILHNVQVIVL